ncbi:hypothetical protein Dsin_025558 [Dipteronia sinensis]|uniref:Reverse transcriptase domain-containing protein n=1 Tax=Dipteronia sinensis TaxID=43782 RepID=A0AAD9ZXK7_9ROSI|nr:hypothetical protein Dsin_025558 [Dipteronia sinensis]
MIGDVKEIDDGGTGDCAWKYVRVRVVINIDQPLWCILRGRKNGVENRLSRGQTMEVMGVQRDGGGKKGLPTEVSGLELRNTVIRLDTEDKDRDSGMRTKHIRDDLGKSTFVRKNLGTAFNEKDDNDSDNEFKARNQDDGLQVEMVVEFEVNSSNMDVDNGLIQSSDVSKIDGGNAYGKKDGPDNSNRVRPNTEKSKRWAMDGVGEHTWLTIEVQLRKQNSLVDIGFESMASKIVKQRIWVIEKELDLLLDKEEIYWRQRSWETWLKLGDKNSKVFHKQASARKARNYISGLYDRSGAWKNTTDEVFDVLKLYFSEIFCIVSPSDRDLVLILDHVQLYLPTGKCSFLDSRFIEEEIRRAVFDMYPTKALRLDGLLALFYQKFWYIVGNKVTKACLGVLNDDHDMEEVNQTLITLIPKIKRVERMTDFRPISLCNVLYKIVVKALANRFKGVLGDLIFETRSAFIPRPLIYDNVIVGFECMHALKGHNKGKK